MVLFCDQKNHRLCALVSAVLCVVWASTARAEQLLTISSVGVFSPADAPEGLSGITYASGNQYYVVEDSGALMHPLTISLNTATGAITSASFASAVTLAGTDLEGIAYDHAGASVYVSDETGAMIREYSFSGTSLSTVSVPTVFASYRTNFSLESLTMRSGGREMWTANEEALFNAGTGVDDGSLSSTSTGSIVRLQRFTRSSVSNPWNADGQWAYQTDPHTGPPFIGSGERSGMSDLTVLPNGKLLVLEREFGGFIPNFRSRIYEVELTGATEVSSIMSLSGATYDLTTKSLLWQGDFALDNFEGLTLGPQLDNGSFSLLMISDGDDQPQESLYSLTLDGTIMPLLGDMDGDHNVTAADVPLFVQALVDRAGYDSIALTTLTGFLIDADLSGDVNQDGIFDTDDTGAFSALLGGPASAATIPEPSALTLAVFALLGLLAYARRRS